MCFVITKNLSLMMLMMGEIEIGQRKVEPRAEGEEEGAERVVDVAKERKEKTWSSKKRKGNGVCWKESGVVEEEGYPWKIRRQNLKKKRSGRLLSDIETVLDPPQ